MPKPWERRGNPNDWSEVTPADMMFAVGREDGFYLVVFRPRQAPAVELEIPQEWVEQHLPAWLQGSEMESTYAAEFDANDAEPRRPRAYIVRELIRLGFLHDPTLWPQGDQDFAPGDQYDTREVGAASAHPASATRKPAQTAWDRLTKDDDDF